MTIWTGRPSTIRYNGPPRTRDLEDLQRSGLLVSDLAALIELGFEKVHVCDLAQNVGGWHWNPPGGRWLKPKSSPRKSMSSFGQVLSRKPMCKPLRR